MVSYRMCSGLEVSGSRVFVSGTRVARVAQGTRKAGARQRCACHEASIPVLSLYFKTATLQPHYGIIASSTELELRNSDNPASLWKHRF